MDRRTFLSGLVRVPGSNDAPGAVRPQSTGLDPYIPSGTEPWNSDWTRIGHLLRRTTMMPKWADMMTLSALTPSASVDLLLNTPSTPTPPTVANDGTTSTNGLDTVLIGQLQGHWAADAAALRTWFAGVMRDAGTTIIEKMTLFWSGHFTTEFVQDTSYVVAPLLWRQNDLYRKNALGNFQDLAFYVTLDGAMLVYLGGNVNTVGAPNENYARELMELYTTGLGYYTEGDVKNSAKILTGWRVGQYTDDFAPNGLFGVYFSPKDHDVGQKSFLGVSFSAIDVATNTEDLVRQNEIRKLVDTIFSVNKMAAAKFICQKIYKFFVYSNPAIPDMTVIQAMADLLIASNFEIKPVMSALLKSAHFFDNANIGAQIKTPAEFAIGLSRQLGITIDLDASTMPIGQKLFDPPNVSGWPGWHDWITTTTYPIRYSEATAAITAMADADVITFIKQFPNYADAQKLMTAMAALLLPRPLSTQRNTDLLAKLLNNSPTYEWPNILNSPSTAATNVRNVLTTIIELPDFQLC